ECAERAEQDDALEADIDHAGAFHDQFPQRRERERSGRAHGRRQERAADRDHAPPSRATRPRMRARSAATMIRMTLASTTDTTTDGTPASRCIAVAPASSAPKRPPVASTARAFNRARSATAIAV